MIDLYTEDWKIEGVDTILVDKDGTFVDSNPYWGRIVELRVKAIIKFYNISEDHFESLCLDLGYDLKTHKLIEKAPIALFSRNEIINLVIENLKELNICAEYSQISKIFNEVHKDFLPEMYDYVVPIDGIEEFFIKMKKAGITLAVVTSDISLNAKKTLEHLGYSKYFDLIIGKDNCTQDKKTGEPALVALEKLGAKKENTISIGDAPMDYEMAQNAGLKGSILVATGQLSFDLLKKISDKSVLSLHNVNIC